MRSTIKVPPEMLFRRRFRLKCRHCQADTDSDDFCSDGCEEASLRVAMLNDEIAERELTLRPRRPSAVEQADANAKAAALLGELYVFADSEREQLHFGGCSFWHHDHDCDCGFEELMGAIEELTQ